MARVISYYKGKKKSNNLKVTRKVKRFPQNMNGRVEAIKYWKKERQKGVKCYIKYNDK